MDLGIKGKRALVCASSKGLGRGCAEALAEAGVNLVLNARGAEALEATAQEIRDRFGVEVTTVACDVTTQDGQKKVIEAAGPVDILVTNAGGPPPGQWTDWDREDFIKALDANMLTPIELIKATVDGMIARGFGRIINITSGAVKAPIAALGLSNGARSGLTGFVAGLARSVASHNVTVNNLLPGAFDTERLQKTMGSVARAEGISEEAAREWRLGTIPAGRFGDPAEFGAACAFLCSTHAGFITGQNLLIDGGAYPGTF